MWCFRKIINYIDYKASAGFTPYRVSNLVFIIAGFIHANLLPGTVCVGACIQEEEETFFIWGKLRQFIQKWVKAKQLFFCPWILMEKE